MTTEGEAATAEDAAIAATAASRGPRGGEPAGSDGGDGRPPRGASFARNTAIFSIATGLSRIAGLAREVLASSYFGLSPAFNAFTIAFYIPNVVRSLFADSALSAAFVPVFTELLEQDRKREAFRLASTLFMVMLAVLGAICALFILGAGFIVPLFTGDEFTHAMDTLAVGLSRVMFPIVLVLGLNGLVVGVLQAYDHFTIPAISPLVWNLVIMAFLVLGRPLFAQDMYAYAVGILVATAVQFAMALPVLKTVGFSWDWNIDWRDPRVKRVFALMLPVTLGLGLINFNVLANSILGSYVSGQAPRAIDAAFRIYMLPQGMFSVAIATVLFPQLSRLAARHDLAGMRDAVGNGLRLIFLMLLPAMAATLVLAVPITRLVFQRGEFNAHDTDLVATALFWFSFSLPFSGVNLLLTRSFFSLQRPWIVTYLSVGNLIVNVGVSIVFVVLGFGIGGIVAGTAIADIVMAGVQFVLLRRELHGRLALRETLDSVLMMLVAAAWFGIAGWLVWKGLDWALGRSLIAQVISVGGGLAAGVAAYVYVVLELHIPEAQQLRGMIARRLGAARA
ncbi:MAG TPA: murein biosynthesis integral membrane protein MurJ [Baekduia sp.]|nr:murein biosynthesis integral membrane protein MurJ [Baekduia sp.]